MVRKQRKIASSEKVTNLSQYKLQPNKMQIAFIKNLKKLWAEKKERALLLSSTGTGKTYASAFALREENPKKALFPRATSRADVLAHPFGDCHEGQIPRSSAALQVRCPVSLLRGI